MPNWLSGLFDSNEKEIKRHMPLVERINALESEYRALSDAALRAKTDEFKARLAEATAPIRRDITETNRRLEEARQNNSAEQAHNIENSIKELEEELHQEEKHFLDDILPEAYAAVREAARRTIGQRHYDVQLIGGVILHQGKIAEMKTGEGKTLVATLPLYLNALTGHGCHLATVNDYLARRDPYWMGPVFHALGLKVASIYPPQNATEYNPARLFDPSFDSGDSRWRHFRPIARKEAYEADITYGTSAEFGFDYLRDNMVMDLNQCVQRPLNFAIVDEVDNLLIDEARTPLIISAPDVEAGQLYQLFARLVLPLKAGTDYEVKLKERSAELTDAGWANVERALKREGVLKSASLFDSQNGRLIHHLRNALAAKEFYKKDQQYVIKRDSGKAEIVIVDEFTGRLMYGRRYSEGLHQAIEAKEHVPIQQESKTFATVTIQNYFRMYRKMGGMTGTAMTEAEEFFKIYKLDVAQIPTNKPMVREDQPDLVYKTEQAKFRAVTSEVKKLHDEGCPVVIGTVSIEKSEYLSDLLKRQGITCQVLNAKQHEKEASIIAGAGEPGAVTVATNMAGRGVDIILGGREPEEPKKPENADTAQLQEYTIAHAEWQKAHDEWAKRHQHVLDMGGLHIIGTERHEARRIDNQLRGRAGRQGDPGQSRFYISLEDDIMRRFGGERLQTVMNWVGMDEDTPIENAMITRAITDVQKRVEGYHFDLRKHLVEYDDVVNKHREVIYGERRKILGGADLKANILEMVRTEIRNLIASHLASAPEPTEATHILDDVATIFPLPPNINQETIKDLKPKDIEGQLIGQAEALYDAREQEISAPNMRLLERVVMLRIIDTLWVEHLTAMEHMRQEIGMQSVAQRDPLVAYKRQGLEFFQNLTESIQHDVVHTIYHLKVEKREAAKEAEPSPMAQVAARAGAKPDLKAGSKKVGRNDACPCGSGKKYKHCCGK
ncbi:MAG: preprotein translocase subunit SecA [Dehalococcoidales bacterium]|nr:preprotein translocase subunit SecA [Dehalococcoidales bacterium]